jgi:hypothetical protein
LLEPASQLSKFDLSYFRVMHHLCRIMGSKSNRGKLFAYIEGRFGFPSTDKFECRCIEELRLDDRHTRLTYALWLLSDLEHHLAQAWEHKAVRFSLMTKDIQPIPKWYGDTVKEFSNWRQT